MTAGERAGLLAYSPDADRVWLRRADGGARWGLPAVTRSAGGLTREAALGTTCPVWWRDGGSGEAIVVARVDGAVPPADSRALDPPPDLADAGAWHPPTDLPALDLAPGLAAAWPHLAPRLAARLALIIDIANVMGSVNDGWYRDRLAAARRWRDRLAPLAERGVAGAAVGWPEIDGFFPRLVLVVEGQAGPVADEPAPPGVELVRAPRDGDGQIVAEAARAIAAGDIAVVATADRELRDRVGAEGAAVIGPGALKRLA